MFFHLRISLPSRSGHEECLLRTPGGAAPGKCQVMKCQSQSHAEMIKMAAQSSAFLDFHWSGAFFSFPWFNAPIKCHHFLPFPLGGALVYLSDSGEGGPGHQGLANDQRMHRPRPDVESFPSATPFPRGRFAASSTADIPRHCLLCPSSDDNAIMHIRCISI